MLTNETMTRDNTAQRNIRAALVGLPGPLMLWLVHAVKTMLWTLGAERAREIWPLDDETILRCVEDPADIPNYVVSDLMTGGLARAIESHAALVLMVVEDPQVSAGFLCASREAKFVDAVRQVSGSIAQLSGTARLPGLVVLPPSIKRLRAGEFLAHLARLLFDEDLGIFRDALLGLGIDLSLSIERQLGLFSPGGIVGVDFTDIQTSEIEQICRGPYLGLLKPGPMDVIWPLDFFIQGELFVAPPPRLIQLIGPARCLYFGPYLSLPRGHWRGEIIFGLSEDIQETHVRVLVMQSQIIADFESVARKGGLYSLAFSFDHKDVFQPVEVRLMLDRGEIEGKIALGQVKLRCLHNEEYPA